MPKDNRPWVECRLAAPPRDKVVLTKIDDEEHGPRNEQRLKQITGGGRLWFTPDTQAYVYYEPTHWLDDEEE